MTSRDEDYEVGYRRPPKHSQFRPGKSGNLNGRPKGKRNHSTNKRDWEEALQKAAGREVSITIDGKTRLMTWNEVIAFNLVSKAAKGDLSAIKLYHSKIVEIVPPPIEIRKIEFEVVPVGTPLFTEDDT